MVSEWDTVFIGDCFEFKNGLNKEKEYFGKGTPIVNYMDVYKKSSLCATDIQGKVTLSKDEISRFKVQKNDVFFTRTSETPEEVGISSVLLDDVQDCVFSGFVLRARPITNRFYPLYCKYCFSTPEIREKIIKNCTYTTRALTNGKQLSEICISLPPIEEQRRIAEALSDMDSLIESLEKVIEKKKAVKQGAMQELLTGKRRLPDFQLKCNYKLTEIEMIPEDWEVVSLKDIVMAPFSYGINAPAISYDPPHPSYIRITDISEDGYFIKENRTSVICKNAENYILHKNDIVFARTGASTGKTYLYRESDGVLVYAGFLIKASINPKRADPLYVFNILHTKRYWNWVSVTSMRSGQPGINGNEYSTFLLPLPSLFEQQCIAETLSDINNEIEFLKQKLAKCRAVKRGMMQELLTGRIRLI